jgi:cytochrome b involved in lipid metabolism
VRSVLRKELLNIYFDMAPNKMELKVPIDLEQEESVHPLRKEILYEGYYYDVTDFIQRHPGGNVIKFYTEPGEDGTLAIQQFHHRSIKQVLAMMKALPKRPVQDKVDHGKVREIHTRSNFRILSYAIK